ncbi:11170_t:CDS:2, partial [Dentiscutata heterogama]
KVQDEHGTLDKIFGGHSKDSYTATAITNVDNVKLYNMFTAWIVNRQYPLLIIEDPELVEIIQYLNPRAQLVKSDAIKNSIAYLSTISSKLSFTSDIWTSPNNKVFVSVIAHYIDECWTFQETLLDFSLLSGKHNRTNISNGFFKVIEDYGITSKVFIF